MVPQTLQFLQERSGMAGITPSMAAFISGARHTMENDSALYYETSFHSSDELFAYDMHSLYKLVQELELHADVNFTITKISYLADVGTGPKLPILIAEREPIARGIGFEIEERGKVAASLSNRDLKWTEKAKHAHQYYSTGLSLLALEDQISGLLDAAYMQFYLSIEAILEAYKSEKAIEKGKRQYGVLFNDDIVAAVKRVFVVRNDYFGHAGTARRSGERTQEDIFAIAKQTLVARWCARSLIQLEVGANLVHREMRFYPSYNRSMAYDGNAALLSTDFALPS